MGTKKKMTALLLLFALTAFATQAQTSINLAETKWKLSEVGGKPVSEGYNQIKIYTKSGFFWYVYDNKGQIIDGAGGDYTFFNNQCSETVKTFIGERMQPYKDKAFLLEVSMLPDGKMKCLIKEFNHEEIWEKIE